MRRALLFVLLLFPLAEALHYRPLLPEYVASNFGEGGRAQAFMERDTLLLMMLGTLLGIALLDTIVVWMVRNLPAGLVNLPNKEFWLTPENRPFAIEKLDKRMFVFTVAMLIFMSFVLHCVLMANLQAEPRLSDSFLTALVGFMIFVALWSLELFFAFRRPDGKPAV